MLMKTVGSDVPLTIKGGGGGRGVFEERKPVICGPVVLCLATQSSMT